MTKGAQLIYLMDPQCGWCFGYSGTIQEIAAHYKDDERLKLELVTGGLFHPALATGPELAEEKRPIAARVSRAFGVTFSEDYFTNVLGSGRLDSLVPCQAINAAKIKAPGTEFEFAGRLISAAFTQGRNISDLSVCLDIAGETGFDIGEIETMLTSTKVMDLTDESFYFAKQVGTGFPSLFLRKGKDLTHLGGVQQDLKSLENRIDDLLT